MINIEKYICSIIDYLPPRIKFFLNQSELERQNTIQETFLAALIEYNQNNEKPLYLTDLYDFKPILITVEILRILLDANKNELNAQELAKILFYATTCKTTTTYTKIKKRFTR